MSDTQPIYPEPSHVPELIAAPSQAVVPAPAIAPAPHVEHYYSPAQFVCVRCGSNNIAQGSLVDFTGSTFEQVKFAPKRITLRFLNSLRAIFPNRSLLGVKAEACRDCGAVLITVDPDELRRVERRR